MAFINVNAANINVNIFNSAAKSQGPASAGLYLLGSDIEVLNVYRGNVGVAVFKGETATVDTVNLMYLTSKIGESNVVAGVGAAITTWNQTGGTGLLDVGATTVTVTAGNLTITGAGAITTLNNEGGVIYPESTGTITTLNMRGGTTDFSRNRTSRTVTTAKLWPIAAVVFDPNVVTLTNALASQGLAQIVANPAV